VSLKAVEIDNKRRALIDSSVLLLLCEFPTHMIRYGTLFIQQRMVREPLFSVV